MRSGAQIHIPSSQNADPNETERLVYLSGSEEQTTEARSIIESILRTGPGMPGFGGPKVWCHGGGGAGGKGGGGRGRR